MTSHLKMGHYWDSICATWRTEASAVSGLEHIIERKAVLECIRIIAECKGRIVTTGCGTSAAAAKKIAHSLCCIERPAFYLDPGDAVHGGLGAVRRDDIVIAISKGGTTREIVNMLPAIASKKAYLIGVTEKPDSLLGMRSDLCLYVKVDREPDEFNMLATASTLAVIAVFDAICIALMRYTNYSREQFSIIHPGGAVGERLSRVNEGREHAVADNAHNSLL